MNLVYWSYSLQTASLATLSSAAAPQLCLLQLLLPDFVCFICCNPLCSLFADCVHFSSCTLIALVSCRDPNSHKEKDLVTIEQVFGCTDSATSSIDFFERTLITCLM